MKSILEQLTITEDPARVDLDKVCSLLCNSYWAKERSREIIEKSIQNSIPISVFANDVQIGFARVLTDHATFAWICDVIVDPEFRGMGVGKSIMTFIQNYPGLKNVRQLLRTADAHGLYEQFGFERNECMTK